MRLKSRARHRQGPQHVPVPVLGNEEVERDDDAADEAQCDDMGLVPNWAMATEAGSGEINLYPGSFSGSGTPQYEFGAEASLPAGGREKFIQRLIK